MVTIPEDFCGYVYLNENRYVCSANGHFVKMLPAFIGEEKNGQAVSGLTPERTGDENLSNYIYGRDESLHEIALLYHDMKQLSFMGGYSFFAPIIIKSNGNADGFYSNLTKEWKQYDAIMFSGGIIDSLYNPKIAALRMPTREEQKASISDYDGAHSIAIKPFSDYSHLIDVEIDGQKAKLMLSVSHGGAGNINSTDLGSLKSFIQLQFDSPQEFVTIHRYIRVIKATLAVLAQQNNIEFDVSIKQKTENDKFMQTGICKVFMDNEDFYKPKNHQVVSIQSLLDYLPQIIRVIAGGEAATILALLPERNKDRKGITITNVQDLCTALEAEYNMSSSKEPTAKDTTIRELRKKIKSAVKEFATNDTGIDPNTETTISSCFQYLDLDLKNKIFSLYEKHKAAVDAVRQKYGLPDMTVESIGKFVQLRNTKAHTGRIAWSDSANQYTALFVLAYSCFFARAGVPKENMSTILLQMF